jgi:hypothetical protein
MHLDRAAAGAGLLHQLEVMAVAPHELDLEMRSADDFLPHTDLDHLAGTWSAEEASAFDRRTKAFEVVDEELWR